MKTLVIAPQPFFSPRGTPLSVYYRTLISSELQLDIDFLTYGQGQNVDIPGVRFIRTPSLSWLGRVKIGPSALKLFHDVFILCWLIYLLIRHRYKLVHAHEEAVFLAVLLKPLFGFKLIYDMHSSLPQQLSNFNYTSNKFVVNTFEWLENKSLEKSEAIITICPDLFHYVNKVLPGTSKNVLIENSILEPVRLVEKDATERGTTTADQTIDIPSSFKKLVVYAGTLEPYQGIDLLVDAVSHVVAAEPDIGFIVVGGTDQQVTGFSRQAERLGISDYILFTGQVSQKTARAYSAMADVLVSPRSSGTNTPLKIYEQLASGKPLVATNIYSHTQVLTEDVAFLVAPDGKDLAAGIIAATGPDALVRTERAKALYDREYSRPVYVEKLKRVLAMVS